ncbi:MAG: 2,3-bisphosphoglycerate-independent phosphoglycerate mutase [Magnetovibrionaceae bacterium]
MTNQANQSNPPKPVVLCILDGWGAREDAPDNALSQAKTPVMDRFAETVPAAHLQASAGFVGLPEGQMGNSEVGHMNIGAGRIVMQDLPKIDRAVADGSLAENAALIDLIRKLKATGGTCHLMGLLSPGGVHSHQDHMVALVRILCDAGVPVALHAFMDGRDTPPKSGAGYLAEVLSAVDGCEGFRLATVSGRFYAMDRDQRWDRVEAAWKALVLAEGKAATDGAASVEAAYDADETDEFITPSVIGDYAGMVDGDGLLMANFRADRAREILAALADPAFDGFDRAAQPRFESLLGMAEYSSDLARLFGALFPPSRLDGILGEVVADAGLKQLRIAETEKYAHVTFFLNGGREAVFEGEERILVPSPKVKTYDLQPEMSAYEVVENLERVIKDGTFDLIVVNFANGDMVGHTGILGAAVTAAETVDACMGRLESAVLEAGGALLITADHGNLEQMTDPANGGAHTAHTTNPVPLLLIGAPDGVTSLGNGRLCDLAPTVLDLMGLNQPAAMTGHSLLNASSDVTRAAE